MMPDVPSKLVFYGILSNTVAVPFPMIFLYRLELIYQFVAIFLAKLPEYNFTELLNVNFIVTQFIFKTNTIFESTWFI